MSPLKLFVIECSVKRANQWSMFRAQGGYVPAHTDPKQLRQQLKDLRQAQQYNVLEFRIRPYVKLEEEPNGIRDVVEVGSREDNNS